MKRLTFLLFLVLCTALGLQAQDLTLPYIQDFSALATGDMLSETGSPTAVAAGTLSGIASVNSAYQAGGAIRLGDGGNVGGFTTQPIDAGAAPFVKVSFNAAAWIAATPAPAKLTLTYGSQSRTVDLQAIGHGWPLSATDMVWYDVTFTAEATSMALIVTTIAESGVENRVFVDNLKIQVVNLVSWSEGFEGSVFPPVGWTAKHISGSKEWTRSTSSADGPIGTACAKVGYANPRHENWLITPQLFPVAGENFKFKIKTNYYFPKTTLHVKISTASNDTSDFTTTALTLSNVTEIPTTWTEHTVDMSAYVGSPVYIGFHVLDTNGLNLFLDDISGLKIQGATCIAPDTLRVGNITTNSANITWTEGGSASSWIVEYSTSPTFTGATSQTVTGNRTLNLAGLTANTQYYVRVKANCGGGEYSLGTKTTFRTNCGLISTDWTEDFSSADDSNFDMPFCWTRVTTYSPYSSSKYPTVTTSGYEGDCMYMYTTGNTCPALIAASPEFAYSLAGKEVGFWLRRLDPSIASTFEVGVMSNIADTSTFVAIQNIDTTVSSWQYYSVVVPNTVSAAQKYLAFRLKNKNGNSPKYYIDNVGVYTYTCAPPMNFSVRNVKTTEAKIVFNTREPQTAWQYAFTNDMTVTNPSTLTPIAIADSNIVITGLTPNTQYKVWVRTICSAGVFSRWTYANVFKTDCTPQAGTINFLEQFESVGIDAIPECWSKISTHSTRPSVVESQPNNGVDSKAIKFSDSAPQYLVLPDFGVPLNTLELNFLLDREGDRSGIFQVGYMTDKTDESTFVPIASFNDMGSANYKKMLHKRVIFNDVENNSDNRYIAFRYGQVADESFDKNWYYWIDSVSVKVSTSCLPPGRLNTVVVKPDSAEISYVSLPGTIGTQYVYGGLSDDPSTLTPVAATGGTIHLSGLSPNTWYKLWMRSECSAGTYGEWSIAPLSFVTPCLAVASLSEDFESVARDSIPECWHKLPQHNKTPCVITPAASYGVDSKAIEFKKTTKNNPQYLILNKTDVALNTLQLRFDLSKEDIRCAPLQVGYMTDPEDSTTFVSVASFDDRFYKTMLPKTVYFNGVADNGNNRYIAFKYNTGSRYWIDNVEVEPVVACSAPTSLNAQAFAGAVQDSAVVTFAHEASATSWQYVLGKGVEVSATPPDSIAKVDITSDNINLSGLEKDKDYVIWVRTTSCGTDTSSWTIAAFSTKYCKATPVYATVVGITKVKFGNYMIVENVTGQETNNYGDYSAMHGDVGRGDSANVAINYTIGSAYKAHIYVDWNNDYDFEDAGETVYTGEINNTSSNFIASFLVPASTAVGNYRMRILINSTYYESDPCYMEYSAAVEDYTLVVAAPLTCRYVKNLKALNITTSSADITWTAGGSETSWNVVVSTTPLNVAQLDTMPSINVTSATRSLTSLTTNKKYYVYVRAACSATDKSPWKLVEFRTKSISVSLPYDQDFSGTSPEVAVFTAEEGANKWSIGSAIGNSGKSMYISKDNGTTAEYAAVESHSMAYITIDFDNSPKFAISFDWIGKGNFYSSPWFTEIYDYMRVYMVPDSAELPTTWTSDWSSEWMNVSGAYRLGNIFLNKTDWTTFADTLPSSYAGSKRKLVFMWINTAPYTSAPTMAVDNISIVGYSCDAPSNMVLDTIATDTARIHWTKAGSETSWILEYKSASEATWIRDTVTDTVYAFGSLTPNTEYRVRIKAVCTGGSTYSKWLQYTFRTECAAQAIGNTRIEYDFGQYIGKIPSCWTRTLPYTTDGGRVMPFVGNYEGYPTDGVLIFGGKSSQMISTGEYIENMSDVEVEFYVLRTSSATAGTFKLGVLSNPHDPSTFTPIHDLTNMITADGTLQRMRLSLSGAPANTHYIAFRQDTTGSANNGMYGIDDLYIYKTPTCKSPDYNNITIVTANDPTATSAEVSWLPGENESNWEIQYKEADSTLWTSVMVSASSMDTLRGLSPQTVYELRIRSVCSATDSSFWTLSKYFATPCAAETLPFSEDFTGLTSSTFPRGCWRKYVQKASDVFAGERLRTSGGAWNYSENTFGLNTGGKAKVNIYGSSTKSWLVTPPVLLQNSTFLEFDVAFTRNDSASPAGGGARGDDQFMVIISEDAGATWTQANATVWNNDGTGNYVLNDITNGVNHIRINLSQYADKIVKIAFYAESTVGTWIDGGNDLHLDNILVHQVIITPPTVETLAADNIGNNTATLHKKVTQGSYPITSEGFYYKAANDTRWKQSTDSVLTNLIQGTTYKFYAYAEVTDDNGVVHKFDGDSLVFTTTGTAPVHPIVETRAATDITQMKATLHKAIAQDPSEPVVTQGWKWRKVGEPNWSTAIDSVITGLEHSTAYEFYAYATTAINTDGYNGATLQFTTLSHTPPTVKTLDATAIGMYAATLRKEVTAGSESIIEEGWEYKKVGEVVWTKTQNANLNSLALDTEYEFYAYAITNSYPMTKGETLKFRTLKATSDLDAAGYGVNIYPNPAHTVVNVDVPSLSGEAEVTVVDMMGKTIGRYTIADGNNSISIDVSSFAEGVYTVRIVSDSITLVERLVIKKR